MAASTRFPPPSARSTITATTSNGSHEVTVEGYSVTKLYAPGEHISTHKFMAAGHAWTIRYYPNRGKEKDCTTLCFSLKMADGWKLAVDGNVRVEVGFSLVPHGTDPAPARFAGKRRVVDFTHGTDREHWCLTVSKKELEKSPEYLRDDSFVLRCEIAVVDKPVVKSQLVGLPVCRCKDDQCKLRHLRGVSWLKDAVATYFLDCLGV